MVSKVMKRRVALLLAGASVLVSLSVSFAWRGAAASAAAGGGPTYMSTEAWYLEPPPCVSLIDCSPASAASPYPKDTLHVSDTAGQETARTYLAFPVGKGLFGGTLTLPIDDAASDGSMTPDQATLQACLVTETFKPVQGSTAKPPKADCKVFSVGTYDPKADDFTIDLTPFASSWTSGTAALAIVPSNVTAQPNATWHVVFYAGKKPSKDAPPITATLDYSTYSYSAAPPPPPATGGTGSAGGGQFATSGNVGGGFTSSFPSQPSVSTTTTTTTTTTQPPAQPALVAPTSLEGFAGPGFAYPAVWALPLLFLAGIGALGRSLTKELYRRGV